MTLEERNYLRAVLTFFQYLKTTMSYNPVDHPKVKNMFRDCRPLSDEECRILLIRLQGGDLGLTMDQIVELTGKDRSVIGRILSRARVKPQSIYDFEDVAPYIELKEGVVFGDTHDTTSPTKKESR